MIGTFDPRPHHPTLGHTTRAGTTTIRECPTAPGQPGIPNRAYPGTPDPARPTRHAQPGTPDLARPTWHAQPGTPNPARPTRHARPETRPNQAGAIASQAGATPIGPRPGTPTRDRG
ncbi:hypothetical protein GCM10020358_84610 [Amorphoplanes nipponensis]